MLGPLLSVGLLQMEGVWGLRGYQWIFMGDALLAAGFCISLQALLPVSAADTSIVGPVERHWLLLRQSEIAAEKDRRRSKVRRVEAAWLLDFRHWSHNHSISCSMIMVSFVEQ